MGVRYVFGNFELEPRERLLTTPGGVLTLRPKTTRMLELFLEHPQKVFGKAELVGLIWEGVSVSDNSLYECVNDARGVLGDQSDAPRFIKTIPRKGYRWIYEDIRKVSPDTPQKKGLSRVRLVGIGLAALIILGLFLMWPQLSEDYNGSTPISRETEVLAEAGSVALGEGRYVKALGHFEACLIQNPDFHLVQLEAALCNMNLMNFAEAEVLIQSALKHAGATADDMLGSRAHSHASRLARYRGDYEQAREHLAAVVQANRRLGRDRDATSAMADLARLAVSFGDLDYGESVALTATDKAAALDFHPLKVRLILILATSAYQRRQSDLWLNHMESAIRLLENSAPRLRNTLAEAFMLQLAELGREDSPGADKLFARARALLDQRDDSRYLLSALDSRYYFARQDYARAMEINGAMLETTPPGSRPFHGLHDKLRLSMLALALRDLPRARSIMDEIKAAYEVEGEMPQGIYPLLRWAYIAGEFGFWDVEEETLARVITLARAHNQPATLSQAHLRLGWNLFRQRRSDQSLEQSQKALELARAQGSLEDEFYALLLQAWVEFGRGNLQQAEALQENLTISQTRAGYSINPHYANLLMLRFRMALARSQWDQAGFLLVHMNRLPPMAYNNPRGRALLHGMLAEARGEPERAETLYFEASGLPESFQGIFPILPDPNLCLARLFGQQKKWQKGRIHLDRAANLFPGDPEVILLSSRYEAAFH